MNPKNSKTSDTHKLRLNLADKINLRRDDKSWLTNYGIYYKLNNIKSCTETTNSKHQKHYSIKNLKYLLDRILYQIFRTILSIWSRSMKRWEINHQSKFMSTKFRTELLSSLKPCIITLNFWHPRLWNNLEVMKKE